jgi:hypothetical protein
MPLDGAGVVSSFFAVTTTDVGTAAVDGDTAEATGSGFGSGVLLSQAATDPRAPHARAKKTQYFMRAFYLSARRKES